MFAREQHCKWHHMTGEHSACGRYGFNRAMIVYETRKDEPPISELCKGCRKAMLHFVNVNGDQERGARVTSAAIGSGRRHY